MRKSVNDFVGVDSLYMTPEGRKMEHDEVWTKVVNAIGLSRITRHVPANRDTIRVALAAGDQHLNTIPLSRWDMKEHAARALLRSVGINVISLSDCVCLLKQAARMWVEPLNEDEGQEG